jgi:hypothetical protein
MLNPQVFGSKLAKSRNSPKTCPVANFARTQLSDQSGHLKPVLHPAIPPRTFGLTFCVGRKNRTLFGNRASKGCQAPAHCASCSVSYTYTKHPAGQGTSGHRRSKGPAPHKCAMVKEEKVAHHGPMKFRVGGLRFRWLRLVQRTEEVCSRAVRSIPNLVLQP